MLKRVNWKEVPDNFNIIHFRWSPFSNGIRFKNLVSNQKRLVNHFEFHNELTNKSDMLRNLVEYCEENQTNAFDLTPATFFINFTSKTWDNDL